MKEDWCRGEFAQIVMVQVHISEITIGIRRVVNGRQSGCSKSFYIDNRARIQIDKLWQKHGISLSHKSIFETDQFPKQMGSKESSSYISTASLRNFEQFLSQVFIISSFQSSTQFWGYEHINCSPPKSSGLQLLNFLMISFRVSQSTLGTRTSE